MFREACVSSGFQAVRVTWSARYVIPWTVSSLLQGVPRPVPCPQFHDCVQPQTQVPARHITPHVARTCSSPTPCIRHAVPWPLASLFARATARSNSDPASHDLLRPPAASRRQSETTAQQHAEYGGDQILSISLIQSRSEYFTPVCDNLRQRPCSHRNAPSGRELSC